MKRWEDYDIIKLPNGETIDMNKLNDEQNRAKAALQHLAPVLGGFLGKLRFIYTFRVDTQATDGYNVFVNPYFTNKLDLTQKAFVMAHEIMHCLLNHLRRGRMAGHDHERSNIAADYECNITLVDMDLFDFNTIQNMKAYIDKKYSGWGYEKIYDDIGSQSPKNSMQNPMQNQSGGQQNQSGQNGQGGQSGDGGNQQNQSGQSGNAPKKRGRPKKSDSSNGNDQNGQGGQQNQSGQNGQGGQGDADRRDVPGTNGKVGQVSPEDCKGPQQLSDTPGAAGGIIDKSTGDQIAKSEGYPDDGGSESARERDWKDAAIKAASKLQGKQAGALKSKIELIYKTSTDWKKTLRNIVGHSISPEEKRQAYAHKNTLISQGRIARTDKDKYDNMDYMMCWIDSSGSMDDNTLRKVLSEVYSVALAKKPIRLIIVQCDTKIQDIQEYRNVNELQRKLSRATVKGRGGTELKPCWDLLKTDPRFKRARPDLIMVFTDGYLTQYRRDPRTMNHFCWVILDNPGFNLDYKDSMTKCVHLKVDDIK